MELHIKYMLHYIITYLILACLFILLNKILTIEIAFWLPSILCLGIAFPLQIVFNLVDNKYSTLASTYIRLSFSLPLFVHNTNLALSYTAVQNFLNCIFLLLLFSTGGCIVAFVIGFLAHFIYNLLRKFKKSNEIIRAWM